MTKRRLFVTSAGTVSCALAIGLVMQSTGPAKRHRSDLSIPSVTQADLGPQSIGTAALADPGLGVTGANDSPREAPLELTSIELTSISTEEPASVEPVKQFAVPQPAIDEEAASRDCTVEVTATPAALASVDLTVNAPCNPNERLSLHHMGMIVTYATDGAGGLKVTLPALARKAVIMVVFDSNQAKVATVDIADFDQIDRVALQWAGQGGFQIHAREFGADYGSAGHVWGGSVATTGPDSGTVARLGEADLANPKLAEVYTFPKSHSTRSGVIALTVEAEVTEANCGRDIAAQSIELRDAHLPRTQDLVLSVPTCSSIGDFLVLNNLIDDLKIAAR